MKDQLNTKITDYCNYVNLTVKNFRGKNYSDSAINSRKAAEAVCKVIIYNSFGLKMAEDKIRGKTLRELVLQLIKDRIAEKKAINNIETLQIIGNKAAHDNVIIKDEAAHCLNALNLLTDYLFNENLKIAIPSTLNFDFEIKTETEVKQPEVIEKIIVQEKIIQQKLDKESEEALFKRIKNLTQAEREKHEAFLDKKQQEFYEKKASEGREVKEKLINEASKRKKQRLKIVIASITTLVLLTVVFVLLKRGEAAEKVIEKPLLKHPDTTYVAINKLDILQDNPQMDFKVESYLNSYIVGKIRGHLNLPIKIGYTNFKVAGFSNQDSILQRAGKLGYDVIYFGNFYESSLDSNILEMNGHFVKAKTIFRDKKIKFKNLTDSSFIKEINDQANISVLYCVIHDQNTRPYLDQIKVLEPLICYSKENWVSIKGYMGALMLFTKDYQKALNIFNVALETNPSDLNTTKLKAMALRDLNMLDSSQVYFDKLLKKQQNNIEVLIQYAYLLILKKEDGLAKEILNKILTLEKNNQTAIDWLSKLNMNQQIKNAASDPVFHYATGRVIEDHGDPKTALDAYTQTYLLDPNYKDIKARMAKCYFDLGDNTNAMKFGLEAVKQDSSNITNTFLYASLLAQVTPDDKNKVIRYYDLSVKNAPKDLVMLQMYGDYLRAHNEIKKCIDICLIARRNFPFDIKIIRLLGGCYLTLENYQSATPLYEVLIKLEPDNVEAMIILANCYLNTSPGPDADFRNGLNYIKTALSLKPEDAIVQLVYARYMQRTNQLQPAREHYLKAKALDKDIKDSNLEKLLNYN